MEDFALGQNKRSPRCLGPSPSSPCMKTELLLSSCIAMHLRILPHFYDITENKDLVFVPGS